MNIVIEGPQGSGKTTQINKLINSNMPANVVYANGDVDTALIDLYDNPPAFGTNIVIFDEMPTDAALKSAKRKANEWRNKVDSKLIAIFEIQTL